MMQFHVSKCFSFVLPGPNHIQATERGAGYRVTQLEAASANHSAYTVATKTVSVQSYAANQVLWSITLAHLHIGFVYLTLFNPALLFDTGIKMR